MDDLMFINEINGYIIEIIIMEGLKKLPNIP